MLPEKYQQRIRINESTNCWEWIGAMRADGYGMAWVIEQKKQLRAHRVVYELLVHKIDGKKVIDHLCRNKRCVNPSHLEEVTSKENTLRGVSTVVSKNKQTHCVHGHELSGTNLYIHKQRGTRHCRQCSKELSALRREGKRNTGLCECGGVAYCKKLCQACYMRVYREKV